VVKTSHNRSVYAAGAKAPSGFRSPRSVAALLPTAHSTHILPALKMLRIFLSGLSKRRIQPERYAKLDVTIHSPFRNLPAETRTC
jgi:hypothetical protein